MSDLEKEVVVSGELAQTLKYGENAWQQPAGLYSEGTRDPLAIDKFKLEFGASLGYNNYADVDRLLQTVTHVAAAFIKNFGQVGFISAGAKHGNVCGVGVSDDAVISIEKMLDGDQRAIFGGSVMCNFAIGEAEAKALVGYKIPKGKRLLDVVVGARFDTSSEADLERKGGRLRALSNPSLGRLALDSLDKKPRTRYVRGGFLYQDNYDFVLDFNDDSVDKHDEALDEKTERDMLLAWAIGSTSNSNTITLVKNGMLIGNGVGQQDRVSAAELAIKRAKDAGHEVEGAVAYSDSFFPFPDGPQKLIDQGVSAIFTTSGSVRDEEVFKLIQDNGLGLYTIPDSQGRGFYAH